MGPSPYVLIHMLSPWAKLLISHPPFKSSLGRWVANSSLLWLSACTQPWFTHVSLSTWWSPTFTFSLKERNKRECLSFIFSTRHSYFLQQLGKRIFSSPSPFFPPKSFHPLHFRRLGRGHPLSIFDGDRVGPTLYSPSSTSAPYGAPAITGSGHNFASKVARTRRVFLLSSP